MAPGTMMMAADPFGSCSMVEFLWIRLTLVCAADAGLLWDLGDLGGWVSTLDCCFLGAILEEFLWPFGAYCSGWYACLGGLYMSK